jgi:hypothetical protein
LSLIFVNAATQKKYDAAQKGDCIMILSALFDAQARRPVSTEFIAKINKALVRWFDFRSAEELAGLDPNLRRQIAEDLAVPETELLDLMTHGHGNHELMPAMVRQLGLSPAAIKVAEPAVWRDMERLCSHCTAVGRCRKDLASGRAAVSYREYCLNAGTIEALKAETGA